MCKDDTKESINILETADIAAKYLAKDSEKSLLMHLSDTFNPLTRSKDMIANCSTEGIKTCTVFRPKILCPDTELQITDAQHSPYERQKRSLLFFNRI